VRSSSDRPRSRARALAGLLAFALLGAEGGDGAAAALDAVQKHYDEVRDIRAKFVQKSFSAALGTETESHGSVVVERPGRMRWEYAPPDGRVIVLDKDAIRIWNPDENQLQIAPLSPDNVSPTALGFLMQKAVLRETFDATAIAAPARPERGLRLEPKSEGGFEYLELWVDPKTHQLRESVVVDLFGNKTRVLLSGAVENAGVPPGAFEIAAPQGAEVLDLR
jgi:outer membrane lipoprotein carrier protein